MNKSKIIDLGKARKEKVDEAIKVPSKEVMMDKFELNMLQQLDQEMGILNNNLGALTRDYRKKEKMLLSKGDDIEGRITGYIETLKKKYKIISLKNIDFVTGKITMD